MSEEILKALAATGGHAHISVLVGMTKLPYESAKNYLELLKKDNKVIYHNSAWHLKIFSNKPAIKRQHTSEKVLECLTDKRTLLDLQCMLPEVKQIQLQETLESLEKAGKIKSMVCYKAVQTNWSNKPTNPVQPIVNKPPQLQQEQTSKPIAVDPVFACQDIRYKDQDRQNSDQFANNRNNRSLGNDSRNQSDSRQNYFREGPKSAQQGPPTRHSQPNNARYPPPNNTGFNNTPFRPFSHNGAQAVRMPCNDNQPPRGPPQNYPQPHNNVTRGPPPPLHEYRPPAPRPRIRLTGIDPYTNKAYGCSDTGYTGPLVPRNRLGFPVRHEAPAIRGHNLAIRQPAPISNNVINHPDSYRRKQAAGRGKNVGRGRSKDMDYTYSKERRTLTCTQKDPAEDEVKAAMRKDSENGDQSIGSWNETDKTIGNKIIGSQNDQGEEKKILKKPTISNSHVLIDSDDSSDVDDDLSLLDLPSLPSIPSMLDDIMIDEQAGNYVPLGSPSQPSDQNLSQSQDITSPAPPIAPSEFDITTTNSENFPSEPEQTMSSECEQPMMSPEASPLHSQNPITPVQQPIIDPSLSTPIQQPIIEPSLSTPIQQPIIDPSLSTPIQQPLIDPSLSTPIQQPIIDPSFSTPTLQPHPNPSLSDSMTSAADQFYTPQSHISVASPAIPAIHDCPDYELELQQISTKLSSYNFGIQSDDSEDDEDDLQDDPNSQVSSKTPTHSTSHIPQPANSKMKIGQLLKPVSMLCDKEGLSHPVLVIQHRPDDLISPWSCEVTVEDTFSGTGEGVSQNEAVQLAAGSVRSALGCKTACRKFKQQTDFYAKMLHFMCKLRGFFPPVYHIVIKTNKVKLIAKIHGDLLHESTGTESVDQVLVSCFEECCEKLYVPVPGLAAWRQEELDYKLCLLGQCPGAVLSSRKVQESWWGEVTVDGVSYQAPRGFPKKWLSEQAAACVACFTLKLPVFNWNLPYVYIGKNTTFPKYRT